MTCREKLEIEYPESASKKLADGCPNDYGYARDPKYCDPFTEKCERCWDREIESEEKKMTVEELVKVIDRSNKFEVREVYDGECLFCSDNWDQPGYCRENFEEIKERIVKQASSMNVGEITIYVNVAPPTEK